MTPIQSKDSNEMMKYASIDIVFQEVPDEISLCFTITGCPLRCKGCHSSHLRKQSFGEVLSYDHFESLLSEYRNYISSVLFIGGEWHEKELSHFLKSEKKLGLKTCLYTGQDWIHTSLLALLDYVKFGPYIQSAGGLEKINTNQRFIEIETNQVLNYKFQNP